MSAEVRKRIVDLVSRALRLPQEEREGFLSQAFGTDRASFAQAKQMLSQQEMMLGYSNGLVLELDEDALDAGTMLAGRYIVVRLVREEPRYRVYEGRDEHTGVPISIRQVIGTAEIARAGFDHEVHFHQQFSHPAIPPVLDSVEDERGFFIIQPNVLTDDFASMLASAVGPMEVARVLKWAEQLLDALEHIHGLDEPLLHGRICPKYLKLTKDGAILLLGLSALASSADLSQLARVGDPEWGAPLLYAAPEVFAGRGGDVRTDIFATAATLYHLLTNEAPPDARLRQKAIDEEQNDPLRYASDINRFVGRPIAELLHRAMSLNPDDRPESAEKFKTELLRVMRLVAAEQQLKQPHVKPGASDPGHSMSPDRAHSAPGAVASGPLVSPEAVAKDTIARMLTREQGLRENLVSPNNRTQVLGQYCVGLVLSWLVGAIAFVLLQKAQLAYVYSAVIGCLVAGYAQSSLLRKEMDSDWWWRATMIGYGLGGFLVGGAMGDPEGTPIGVLRFVGGVLVVVSIAQFMVFQQRVVSPWLWLLCTPIGFGVGSAAGAAVAQSLPPDFAPLGYLAAGVAGVAIAQGICLAIFKVRLPFERSVGSNAS